MCIVGSSFLPHCSMIPFPSLLTDFLFLYADNEYINCCWGSYGMIFFNFTYVPLHIDDVLIPNLLYGVILRV